MDAKSFQACARRLGVKAADLNGKGLDVFTPITGARVAGIAPLKLSNVAACVKQAHAAFLEWRSVPAPVRGELVRLYGEGETVAIPCRGAEVAVRLGKRLHQAEIVAFRPGQRHVRGEE